LGRLEDAVQFSSSSEIVPLLLAAPGPSGHVQKGICFEGPEQGQHEAFWFSKIGGDEDGFKKF